MKNVFKVLLILAMIVLCLALAKNLIAKTVVENAVTLVTGLKMEMKGLDVSLTKTYLDIDELKLHNPKGYQDKVMLDMPEIYVDYDLPAIFKSKVHLNSLKVHLKEFIVVKNADGSMNLDSLTSLQKQAEPKKAEKPKKEGKPMEIQLDDLHLQVGKVIFKDYSVRKGGDPIVKEFAINLDEHHENITDPFMLVNLIVVKVLRNTALAGIVNFDLKALDSSMKDAMALSGKITSDVASAVSASADEAAQKAAGEAAKAADALKAKTGDTTDAVQEKTKALFGSLKEKVSSVTE